MLAVAFVGISLLPTGKPVVGILAFGLAGIGCSALLPLTISFGQEELVAMSASVAGGAHRLSYHKCGYGLAVPSGAGPLQAGGVDLPDLFGIAAGLAVVMAGLAHVIARVREAPAALHPRPQATTRRPTPRHLALRGK